MIRLASVGRRELRSLAAMTMQRAVAMKSSSSSPGTWQTSIPIDDISIPAIGEPATFSLDPSKSISEQIRFDDELDEIFASVPEEQLDPAYYHKDGNEMHVASSSRHEVIDIDAIESVYEEDSELDEIFASLDEEVMVGSQLSGFTKKGAEAFEDRQHKNAVQEITHSPPHSPLRQKEKIRSRRNKWSGGPIRFDDDVLRRRSALQKDIINTLQPVQTGGPSNPRRYYAAPNRVLQKSFSESSSNSAPNKKTAARLKELRKQDLEAGLPVYSYLRPAGAIESMRKHKGQGESSLGASASTPAKGPVCTHCSPRLHISSVASEMDEALKVITSGQVLSFDMEWPVTRTVGQQMKTSVLQIASPTDIFILQVGNMKSLPQEVLRIIRDTTIVKCGVAIRMDAIKLKKDFGPQATMTNMVELSNMAKFVEVDRWKGVWHMISLRDLCRVYLKKRLNKDTQIRAGAWQNTMLDEQQTEYAASDAYVGLEILYSMAAILISGGSKGAHDSADLFNQAIVKEAVEKSKCAELHPVSKAKLHQEVVKKAAVSEPMEEKQTTATKSNGPNKTVSSLAKGKGKGNIFTELGINREEAIYAPDGIAGLDDIGATSRSNDDPQGYDGSTNALQILSSTLESRLGRIWNGSGKSKGRTMESSSSKTRRGTIAKGKPTSYDVTGKQPRLEVKRGKTSSHRSGSGGGVSRSSSTSSDISLY